MGLLEKAKSFTKKVYIIPVLPQQMDLPKYKMQYENAGVQYLKVFFDYAYYLLLIPFRLKWNKNHGRYYLVTSKVQRVLCWLTKIIGCTYYVFNTRQKYNFASESGSPTMIFDLAYYICDTLYLCLMFGVFGGKAEEVCELFAYIQERNHLLASNAASPMQYVWTRRVAGVICAACAGTLGLYYMEVLENIGWNVEGAVGFFKEDSIVVFGDLAREYSMICTAISFFANSLERLLNAFSDIQFTMTVMMFREIVKDFRKTLRHNEKDANEVLNHFRLLKDLTERTNHVLSLVTGSFVVGNLPFYATNVLDTFQDASNNYMRFRYLFYCTYFFPSLFMAARASKAVEEVRPWIYREENYKQLNLHSLNIVIEEIGQTVGLGSYGCFVVTHNFFGSIISIIATYAMMKSQFQGEAAGGEEEAVNATITS